MLHLPQEFNKGKLWSTENVLLAMQLYVNVWALWRQGIFLYKKKSMELRLFVSFVTSVLFLPSFFQRNLLTSLIHKTCNVNRRFLRETAFSF